MVLGLQVRALPVDVNARAGYGLDAATFRAAVGEDRAAGRAPFILIATVGTTTSGAVDRVGEVGRLCELVNLRYFL